MQIKIKNLNMKNMLSIISGSMKKKNKNDILSYIFIKTIENRIFFISINEEMEIVTHDVLSEKTEDGIILIKYDLINNICKTTKENSIIIIKKTKKTLEIKSENSMYKMPCIDNQIFPSFEIKSPPLISIRIKTFELKHLLLHTPLAVSENNPRLFLNGILLDINKHGINALSSDGFRLIFSHILNKKHNKNIKIIVPKMAINEIINSFKNSAYTDILIFENQIQFSTKKINLTSKLINDTYYNPKINISSNKNTILVIKKDEIKQALEKTNSLSKKTNKVIFIFANNKLIIKSQNNYEYANVIIKTEYKNLNIKIGINYKHFTEILRFINHNLFEMIISENKQFVIIKEKNSKYIYITIPLKI